MSPAQQKSQLLTRAQQKAHQQRADAKARRACTDAVWKRSGAVPFDGGEASWCEQCKAFVVRGGRPSLRLGHVHEWKPRSLGGDPTDPDGCVLLCVRCHQEAHRLRVGKAS